MPGKILRSPGAPEPIGPYSQAIQTDKLIFTSGQIAINPRTGSIDSSDIAGQTRQVLENLSAVLQSAGVSLNAVIKTTVFLKDMNDFPGMNEIYGGYFSEALPARSTVQVARLPKDALIEIECVADVSQAQRRKGTKVQRKGQSDIETERQSK
jgi:2-iminobutanoate/2-iminopropanoate deaminase